MKKLLLALIVLISFVANSQITPPTGFTAINRKDNYLGVKVDSIFGIPRRDTQWVAPLFIGEMRYQSSDSTVYIAIRTSGAGAKWLAVSRGGTNNANVGSGFRLLKPGTQEIKSIFDGYGLAWDSTSNTNGLTGKVDTFNIGTRNYVKKAVDSAKRTYRFGREDILEDAANREFTFDTYNFDIRLLTGYLRLLSDDPGHELFRIQVEGEDLPRWEMQTNGLMEWGRGSGNWDFSLENILGNPTFFINNNTTGFYLSTVNFNDSINLHFATYTEGVGFFKKAQIYYDTVNSKFGFVTGGNLFVSAITTTTDTSAFKPMVWNPTTKEVRKFDYWPGGSGGGGSADSIIVRNGLTVYSGGSNSDTLEHGGRLIRNTSVSGANTYSYFLDSLTKLQIKTVDSLSIDAPKFAWRGGSNTVDTTNFKVVVKNPATGEMKYAPWLGSGGGGGSVTDFIFTDGNGFDGTVTNSTTTPTLSLTTTVSDGRVMYSSSGAITGSANMTFTPSGGLVVNTNSSPVTISNYPSTSFGAIWLSPGASPAAGNYAIFGTSGATVINSASGYVALRINDNNTALFYLSQTNLLNPTQVGGSGSPGFTLDVQGTFGVSGNSNLNGKVFHKTTEFDEAILTTSDATATTILTIDCSSSNTTFVIEVTISGYDGTDNDVRSIKKFITVKNQSGTVSIVNENDMATAGTAGSVTASTVSGTNLLVRVTGEASHSIYWIAERKIIKAIAAL